MSSFGIIANPDKYSVKSILKGIFDWCIQHDQTLIISPKIQHYFNGDTELIQLVDSEKDVIIESDYIISVGGDGTILWTSQLIVNTMSKPILGINSGRLGFMANIPKKDYVVGLDCILNKSYDLNRRYFLESYTDDFGRKYALNEFLFSKTTSTAMITIDASYNNKFINSYWADGLIIASPSGSTAYNLSAGGPIVAPESEVLILTPISPHTLTTRPLIIPSKGNLTIEIPKQENPVVFSYDGENMDIPRLPYSIEIKKSDCFIDIIELPEYNYFGALRTKLMWGKDSRG